MWTEKWASLISLSHYPIELKMARYVTVRLYMKVSSQSAYRTKFSVLYSLDKTAKPYALHWFLRILRFQLSLSLMSHDLIIVNQQHRNRHVRPHYSLAFVLPPHFSAGIFGRSDRMLYKSDATLPRSYLSLPLTLQYRLGAAFTTPTLSDLGQQFVIRSSRCFCPNHECDWFPHLFLVQYE